MTAEEYKKLAREGELPKRPVSIHPRLGPEKGDRCCGRNNAHTHYCELPPGSYTSHPGTGRCRRHGGASPKGLASPHVKHGRYSKAFPQKIVQAYKESLADPKLGQLKDEIALATTRIKQLGEIQKHGSEQDRLEELKFAVDILQQHYIQGRDVGDPIADLKLILEDPVEISKEEEASLWKEIGDWEDRLARLVTAEERRKKSGTMFTAEQLIMLIAPLIEIIQKNVSDRREKAVIQREITKLTSGSVIDIEFEET